MPDTTSSHAPHPGAPAHDVVSPPAAPSRRRLLGAVAPAGVGLLALGTAAACVGPRTPPLGEATGDSALADALRPHLDGHHRVAAALIDQSSVRTAGFGADESAEFEIGSVTKTMTGALLLDAVARGEVALDSQLGDLLGSRADGSSAAAITLQELATHTSGLPRLPGRLALTSIPAGLLRRDPYARWFPEDVLDAVLGSSAEGGAEHAYSNYDAAVLGQVLAEQAGTSWEDLLTARLLEPLALTATRAPTTADALGEDAPQGRTSGGASTAAWTMNGFAPAGAVRSTAADMATYVGSLIEGTSPGADGLDPLVETGERSAQAISWMLHKSSDGQQLVWHSGMTGGFASFCGWNQDTGRGVVLLTSVARSLDDLGVDLLTGEVAA